MLKSFLSSSEPIKKRKRRSDAKVKVVTEQSYKSPYQPQTPVSPDLDTFLQAEIAREEAVGDKRQRKDEYNVLQDYQQPKPRSIMPSRDRYPQANTSRGWTVANVQPPPVVEPMNYIRPAPVQQTTNEPPPPSSQDRKHEPMRIIDMTANERPPPNFRDTKQESTIPVIDMLSKGKQRHIYGIVSGLQGGIDSVQKQLNMLRASLGIEFEDEGAGN